MAAFKSFSSLLFRNTNLKAGIIKCNGKHGLDCRTLSYLSVEYAHEKNDPAAVFFRMDVQTLLKSLTRPDLKRVFKKRKTGDKQQEDPVYKFLTEEELQEAYRKSQKKAEELLQMPPVVKVRKEIDTILSKDPALQGLDTSRFVFTDISFGVKDSKRAVIVREPDGTLREAEWSVKDRMNQIYFPKVYRQLRTPKMFEGNHFEDILNRKEYEYILDRACLQFEPNDPEYQRVTSVTYQHINDNNEFEALRSTRHFGGLTFFLVWNKNIDNLLLDLIETAHMEEVGDLLKLYEIVNAVKFEGNSELELVKDYIMKYSKKKGAQELALQAYCELVKQKEELKRGIKVAHGAS